MKDFIVRILLIVILLALFVTLNTGVSDLLLQQKGMNVVFTRGRSLWVGLGRWMSHVNWMLLLQKRASISGKRDPAVARALHKRYDMTTDEDPFLVMAYEHGGVELATIGKPDLGLRLLDKGIAVVGETNWKLPSYAAQIVTQYCKDDPQARDKAKAYLEQARKVNDHPFYIESALVRIRGKDIQDNPVKMAKLWQEVGSRMDGDRSIPPGRGGGVVDGTFTQYSDRYNQQACEKVIGILREVREEADKENNPAQKAEREKQADAIVEIIKTMMGSRHACGYCFSEYDPGDQFCPNCGRSVEVYGVCVKCGKVLAPDDKYCPACGAKAPPPRVRKTEPMKPPKPAAKK